MLLVFIYHWRVAMSPMKPDLNNCKHNFILEGVCECLEMRRCKHAYTYGGDVFCKHPSAHQGDRQYIQGQKAFEYAGIFD